MITAKEAFSLLLSNIPDEIIEEDKLTKIEKLIRAAIEVGEYYVLISYNFIGKRTHLHLVELGYLLLTVREHGERKIRISWT